MAKTKHTWAFRARFRKGAYGWRSATPIKRVKEAVSEIQKVFKTHPALAAEGATLFLEKVSPALQNVDSSSGAIGNAVGNAIATLVPIIQNATLDAKTRHKLLERLWNAYVEDEIPYIEALGDHWGELCATPDIAAAWVERLLPGVQHAWSQDAHGYLMDSVPCLSAMLVAGQHTEILGLLELAPTPWWHYRRFGVQALVALGKIDEAIELAEERMINDSSVHIAHTCEAILRNAKRTEEAYQRYALEAHQARTYLAWFRNVKKAYPAKKPSDILEDLVATTPGEAGKWFAAAKSEKLWDEAIALARRSPCSPKTLTRAARDFAEKRPTFALEAGLTALGWLLEGYGYEVTGADVHNAYEHTMKAADNAGLRAPTLKRIQHLVEFFQGGSFAKPIVARLLAREDNTT